MGKVFLTGQQVRVLRLLSLGLTTREIAIRMGLTERSVYTHIRKLKVRLKASTRAQILLQAARFCPDDLRGESENDPLGL
jgi:DNA-binding CsgD family transcriptional regulator